VNIVCLQSLLLLIINLLRTSNCLRELLLHLAQSTFNLGPVQSAGTYQGWPSWSEFRSLQDYRKPRKIANSQSEVEARTTSDNSSWEPGKEKAADFRDPLYHFQPARIVKVKVTQLHLCCKLTRWTALLQCVGLAHELLTRTLIHTVNNIYIQSDPQSVVIVE